MADLKEETQVSKKTPAPRKKIDETKIVDYDADVTKMREERKKQRKLENMNSIQISATVDEIYLPEPRQKLDKDKNPIIDQHTGEVQYWPRTATLTVLFNGGSLRINIPENMLQTFEVEEQELYLFKGRFGEVRNFGQTETGFIVKTIEEI